MCCERIFEDEAVADIWDELRVEYARACTDLGVTLVRRGRVIEGRPYLRRGVEVRWSLRAMTLYGLSYAPILLPGRAEAPAFNEPFSKPVLLNVQQGRSKQGIKSA